MSASQHLHIHSRELQLRRIPKPTRHLDELVLRALNKVKRPSTAGEITLLVNEDLGATDRPFGPHEIEAWLRRAGENVMALYWLGNRPRR